MGCWDLTAEMTGLKHGLYKIVWKRGGASLAAVGYTYDGTNWYSCANWTTKNNKNPVVASCDFSEVEHLELLIENDYETMESCTLQDRQEADVEQLKALNSVDKDALYKAIKTPITGYRDLTADDETRINTLYRAAETLLKVMEAGE